MIKPCFSRASESHGGEGIEEETGDMPFPDLTWAASLLLTLQS